MTQNRRFKKRVRARIAKTGESYAAACRHLRRSNQEDANMAENEFQTIINHDFGYRLAIPVGWRDVGPHIYNSVFEIARYLRNEPRIADGIVNLFWDLPGASSRQLAESGDCAVFDLNRACLEKEGVTDISISEVTIGNRPATRLDHAYRLGDIDNWASRSYFMAVRNTFICLNMGTSSIEANSMLYDDIAASFHVVDEVASVLLVRDDKTPDTFIVDVLEHTFDYSHDKALQRLVLIKAQHECVVALVDASKAANIVDAVNAQSHSAGYSLRCRVAN